MAKGVQSFSLIFPSSNDFLVELVSSYFFCSDRTKRRHKNCMIVRANGKWKIFSQFFNSRFIEIASQKTDWSDGDSVHTKFKTLILQVLNEKFES